jgi:hypothetical protein
VREIYKGFEIEAKREPSLAGIDLLYFNVFRLEDGWELTSDFTYGEDTEEAMIGYMKSRIDDFLAHPEDYD